MSFNTPVSRVKLGMNRDSMLVRSLVMRDDFRLTIDRLTKLQEDQRRAMRSMEELSQITFPESFALVVVLIKDLLPSLDQEIKQQTARLKDIERELDFLIETLPAADYDVFQAHKRVTVPSPIEYEDDERSKET